MRDELQRALGSGLTEAVHHSVATETRAAVAEAVQAARRWQHPRHGARRGERGRSARPCRVPSPQSMEMHVGGRVEAAVRDSIVRAVPAAVEGAIEEFVASRITVLVRDTLEREMREMVAPALNEMVREMLAATLQQAVSRCRDRGRADRGVRGGQAGSGRPGASGGRGHVRAPGAGRDRAHSRAPLSDCGRGAPRCSAATTSGRQHRAEAGPALHGPGQSVP